MIALLMLMFANTAQSQQPLVYNQFFMNPYVYNPAYAGVEGHSVLFFMYKNQYSNIDGAPQTFHANFHVPLKGGVAFGASAYNESHGILSTTAGKVTGGYLVSIDREHFIRFGLSIGAGNHSINFSEFDSPNDPAFTNITNNNTFLVGDFGATYHFGHFNVGFAMPSLFGYEVFTEESFSPITIKGHENVLFKMNYRGHVSDNLAFEPHLIYRYNKVLPNQYEATLITHLAHVVWLGGTYRQDAGFIALAGAKIKESLAVGLAYEVGNFNYYNQLGPSYEIHIGYHIGAKKDHAEHVSSFIKSHRLSAEERAKKEELERQRRLQALEDARNQQNQSDELTILQEPEKKEEPEVKEEPEKEPEVKEEPKATDWKYDRENQVIERTNENGQLERGIRFDRINEQGEEEVIINWLPEPAPGADETWQIAHPDVNPEIRTNPDGSEEIGVKWIRKSADGTEKEEMIWSPVLTEQEAHKIDQNEEFEKVDLDEAVITMHTDQVEQEPVQEPIIVKEPIQEEPVKQPEVTTPEPEQQEVDKGDPALTNDFRPHEEIAKSDTHMEVRRGGHLLELPAGSYVVAGVFESFNNAENYSDKLFNQGFHEVKVGYLSARGYYYVVITESIALKAANSERQRIRKMPGLSDVWVLKVNE